MNKIIKHKILAGAMLFGFMLAGSSCEDNEGIRVTPETPYADKTLYEVIENDPELSHFVEILNACGDKCADSLFNQSRVYTVWAPVNPIANKDSLVNEAKNNGNRDIVFRSFVEAHVANHLVPANGELKDNNLVLLLNKKNAIFAGGKNENGYSYTFSGIELEERNIRVRNGIIHKIKSPSEYKFSIWEYLKVADNVKLVSEFLYSYNVTKFNEGQSVAGPIIDGEQTFIDSVFVTSNKWLDAWTGVGNLDKEDSSYVVYVPTDELWLEMIAKTEAYFNYDSLSASKIEWIERDSLRRHYARFHNLKYITFSNNEQKHLECTDSALPAFRGVAERPLFPIADLEKNVIFEKELSNGTFKVVNAMPYKPTDLWHDTIFLEAEREDMWSTSKQGEILTAYKGELIKEHDSLGVEVSGGRYFSQTKNSATTVRFKIPKVLSAKYEVAIIFVPKNITIEQKKTNMYPNNLEIMLGQTLGSGGIDTLYISKYNSKPELSKSLKTNPFVMDTLFLTTDSQKVVVQPKYCEFYDGKNATSYNLELTISSKTKSRDEPSTVKYDASFRIDKIMLIPVRD